MAYFTSDLAPDHLPILFWKHAKFFLVLCYHQGCSTRNCLGVFVPRPKFMTQFGYNAHLEVFLYVPHPYPNIFTSNLEELENRSWREVRGQVPQAPVASPLDPYLFSSDIIIFKWFGFRSQP